MYVVYPPSKIGSQVHAFDVFVDHSSVFTALMSSRHAVMASALLSAMAFEIGDSPFHVDIKLFPHGPYHMHVNWEPFLEPLPSLDHQGFSIELHRAKLASFLLIGGLHVVSRFCRIKRSGTRREVVCIDYLKPWDRGAALSSGHIVALENNLKNRP